MIEDNRPNGNTISHIINIPSKDDQMISIPIPEYHPNNISNRDSPSPINNISNSKESSKISNIKSFNRSLHTSTNNINDISAFWLETL